MSMEVKNALLPVFSFIMASGKVSTQFMLRYAARIQDKYYLIWFGYVLCPELRLDLIQIYSSCRHSF